MTPSNPVRRIAAIVDVVASSRDGLTLLEIGQRLDIPPSTTHRTVNILLDIGYLELDPATKTYSVGGRLRRVLFLTLGSDSLPDIAKPLLIKLSERFGETAFLVQLTSSGPQLVDYCFPKTGSRTLVHPGFEFPLHATASGKAIFAFQSDEMVKAELAKPIERFMPNTMTGKAAIRKELEKTRRAGFAVNDSELDPGVFSLAAPVRVGNSDVIGSIGIAGIRDRLLNAFSIDTISPVVVDAANEVSMLLPDVANREQKNQRLLGRTKPKKRKIGNGP